MTDASQAQPIALPPGSQESDLAPPRQSLAQRLRLLCEDNLGLLLIGAAQFFFTLMNISAKFLNRLEKPVPTLELVLVRMSITYVFSIAYMILRKIPHALLGPPGVRSLLVFRGFSGFFGLFGMYYSLKYLSLSDSVVLTFISPTTTAIAGYFFLGEALARKEVFAGLSSFSGVVLIARPQALYGTTGGEGKVEDGGLNVDVNVPQRADIVLPTQRLAAVGVAMLGVAGATGVYISIRAIGTRAHALHTMTYYSFYSVVVSTVAMFLFQIPPVMPSEWKWCGHLFAMGIYGFIAQILLATGLQRETASRGSLAMYIQIIFATVFDQVLFKTKPHLLSLLGMIIIIGSGLYVMLTKEKAPDAYKLLPSDTDDLEARELVQTPQHS